MMVVLHTDNISDAFSLGFLFLRLLVFDNMLCVVIAAHCGTEGHGVDDNGVVRDCFSLFLQLMDDPKYKNLLYGGIMNECIHPICVAFDLLIILINSLFVEQIYLRLLHFYGYDTWKHFSIARIYIIDSYLEGKYGFTDV